MARNYHDKHIFEINGKQFPVYFYDQLEILQRQEIQMRALNLKDALGVKSLNVPNHKESLIRWILDAQAKAMGQAASAFGMPGDAFGISGGYAVRSASPTRAVSPERPVSPAARKPNPLRIGATIPNFALKTTEGSFKFHDWLMKDPKQPWTLFFSHPKDFTPVCTTELGQCHVLSETFAKIGCKMIGVSCDPVEDHHAWSTDVLARVGRLADRSLNFPIIADADRRIVTELGMLDPEEIGPNGIPLPARALVVLLGTTVKLTILYPATTGRDFEEVLRVVTSLQLTANNGLATPVNWNYGERVIVGPPVKTEDAKAKFTGFQQEQLPSGKPYLRSVDCPDVGKVSPMQNGH